MPASSLQILAANIKRLRKARAMTQEQLAFSIGVNQHFISELEHGKNNATVRTVEKLAEALNATIPELFTPHS
jgi:transcriptional regulator with XRE-family HTH domain